MRKQGKDAGDSGEAGSSGGGGRDEIPDIFLGQKQQDL